MDMILLKVYLYFIIFSIVPFIVVNLFDCGRNDVILNFFDIREKIERNLRVISIFLLSIYAKAINFSLI